MATVSKVTIGKENLEITFSNGDVSSYHHIWLRDNCHCETCYYAATKQRLLNSATIDPDIKAMNVEYEKELKVSWPNHVSSYSFDWLHLHAYNPALVKKEGALDRVLWQVKDFETSNSTAVAPQYDLPSVEFSTIVNSTGTDEIKDWSLKIWNHGFCLINNVPETPEDTEILVSKLSYIRPTHYGGFWDFTSDLSKADTAYTNIDISSHTDGTYWSDTPGLQLFHLLYHDGTGGTTSLVDAFKCAEILKSTHPESFEILTRIPIPAHSAGEELVCIQPDIPQPVFKLDLSGELIQVRWNQSDRSTMDTWSDPNDIPKFYKAIRDWIEIISSPVNQLFYQLKPGQCLIFDNWRVFHSRTEFTGKRRMCGAYINRDDFVSQLRVLVLGREEVLRAL